MTWASLDVFSGGNFSFAKSQHAMNDVETSRPRWWDWSITIASNLHRSIRSIACPEAGPAGRNMTFTSCSRQDGRLQRTRSRTCRALLSRTCLDLLGFPCLNATIGWRCTALEIKNARNRQYYSRRQTSPNHKDLMFPLLDPTKLISPCQSSPPFFEAILSYAVLLNRDSQPPKSMRMIPSGSWAKAHPDHELILDFGRVCSSQWASST